MGTFTGRLINHHLLSKPEGAGHWPQAWGTIQLRPFSSASSLQPDAGPGSQLLLHHPAPFRGSQEETSQFPFHHSWPQPPFLPPTSTAGARAGGSRQRFPGTLAVMCHHEIRLPSVCPPNEREEAQLLERQGHR